nr:MAG TPA: hypothetical protein [Caudoviricetes sp.]
MSSIFTSAGRKNVHKNSLGSCAGCRKCRDR